MAGLAVLQGVEQSARAINANRASAGLWMGAGAEACVGADYLSADPGSACLRCNSALVASGSTAAAAA